MKPEKTDLQRILLEGIDHHEAGRHNQARAAFRQALKIDPGQHITLYISGRMACDAGNPGAV